MSGVDNHILYLAKFSEPIKRSRTLFYLQQKTRPDFDDDVPSSELALFEAVDEQKYPVAIKELASGELFWMSEDSNEDFEFDLAERLGAESALTVSVRLSDEPCFTISQKLLNGNTQQIFTSVCFDDIELDKPIEDFQLLLESKIELGALAFIQWLQQYIEEGEVIPKMPRFV